MAKATAMTHARHTRWSGTVIAVTIIAGRRAEIAAFEQRAAVDAGPIFSQLIGRERSAIRLGEPGHGCGVGMTRAAGRRHPRGKDLRLRILGRTNAVNAMATYDCGRALVVFHKQHLSVWTILKLG